jgi:hypothetical protein
MQGFTRPTPVSKKSLLEPSLLLMVESKLVLSKCCIILIVFYVLPIRFIKFQLSVRADRELRVHLDCYARWDKMVLVLMNGLKL